MSRVNHWYADDKQILLTQFPDEWTIEQVIAWGYEAYDMLDEVDHAVYNILLLDGLNPPSNLFSSIPRLLTSDILYHPNLAGVLAVGAKGFVERIA
ncbi:MAG: hypothetical protein GYB68_17080, partial [Chloroflexi bacterium]|nr:hypothetical protein [Chloroflexota bacterium]